MQKNIRKKQTQLTQFIKKEKYNPNPGQHKINNTHQQLQDINNYKTAGSIIRSKEKLILEQEKPNKFLFDQGKQKQKSKTIKQLQHTTNNETKTITTDYEILKYCKNFFSNVYTKTKTNTRTMGKLGYSKTFINFMKKIYQNTESMISNNGFLSSTFPLTRGVRQGCPLSLLLYIINNEIINLNIKANKKVVGYPIPNQKQSLKLSQYADDALCR